MSIEKFSRTNPYQAHILERFCLTGEGSTKKTFHLSLSIDPERFPFQVGDSIGILVQNAREEVEQILKLLKKPWDAPFAELSLGDFLLTRANLGKITSGFFKTLCPNEEDATLLQGRSLLELLELFPVPETLNLSKLMPLLPRFYSIANSPLFFPGEIHLTLSYLTYFVDGKRRQGVASRFLCEIAETKKTPIPIYLQPTHSFRLPEDPAASIILIGPGTGVAPFRAFLQHRIATQADGRSWLFFGERNRATDFTYGDFFLNLEREGRLRLSLAFSRDTHDKVYVQHKMLEEKKSLWEWISQGATLYVCGDAEEMAKDVDKALHQIAHECGALSEEESRKFIKELRLKKRYLVDVY